MFHVEHSTKREYGKASTRGISVVKLLRLDIQNVRNLQSLQLQFQKNINLFVGPNGSGKTSILEAISLLGKGRSFRTHLIRDLVSHESAELHVFGEMIQNSGEHQKIGVSKHCQGGSIYRLNGQNVKQPDLLTALPLQIITPTSFQLLHGSSRERRHFLDYIMFHVEHSYGEWWQSYHRALKQRTEALKQRSFSGPWEQEMAHYGTLMTQTRQQWGEIWLKALKQVISVDFQLDLKVSFWPGWDTTEPLLEVLQKTRGQDAIIGLASQGPHRADVRCTIQGRPIAKMFSRGQLKRLVITFYLAQANVLCEYKNIKPLWLLDDIVSEIDPFCREILFQQLIERDEPLFITSVDPELCRNALKAERNTEMFHVEH
jgi:DNA replication and repair protein RecF